MCVYYKGAPVCDHERDACAASRSDHCVECGHGSSAFLAYTPGQGRFNLWLPSGRRAEAEVFEERHSNGAGDGEAQEVRRLTS
jgi:hypothetical protein